MPLRSRELPLEQEVGIILSTSATEIYDLADVRTGTAEMEVETTMVVEVLRRLAWLPMLSRLLPLRRGRKAI